MFRDRLVSEDKFPSVSNFLFTILNYRRYPFQLKFAKRNFCNVGKQEAQGWFLGELRGMDPLLLKLLFILGGSALLKILAFALLFEVY